MQVTNTYTDDKLPCVEFTHNGVEYELWWTSHKLVAALEMVSEGEVELEKALKKYPDLVEMLNNPFNAEHADFDGMDENEYAQNVERFQYCMDFGYLTTERKKG